MNRPWDTIANPSRSRPRCRSRTVAGSVVFENLAPAGTMQVSYFGNITGTGVSITGGNDLVLYNFQPVPEPEQSRAQRPRRGTVRAWPGAFEIASALAARLA